MKISITSIKSKYFAIILPGLILITSFFYSCNKSEEHAPAPSISSFSPKTDTVGALITINGVNFSSNATDNIVKIGGVTAQIVQSSTTQITVKIPEGVQNGPITVTVNGQTSTSSDSFTFTLPVITGFKPYLTGIGFPVEVTGTSFSSDISKMTAAVNGKAATITSASSTKLTIIVPDDAGSGNISITANGQTISSSSQLIIKKLTVSTIAGTGVSGNVDGPGNLAQFSPTFQISPDGHGNFLIADFGNAKIRKMTPDGTISTWAGTGSQGYANGPVATATFAGPFGVVLDHTGITYIADLYMNNIRKLSTDGIVSSFAGDIYATYGLIDGTGSNARFSGPIALVADKNDNIFVADNHNAVIRKITPDGLVTTFAGTGISKFQDGIGTSASFLNPQYITIDDADNLYVADQYRIRKITPAGLVTTVAGSDSQGLADGQGITASFENPLGIVVDATGNIYVVEGDTGWIRMITTSGYVATLAGNGTVSAVDGVGHHASFSNPIGIAIDPSGYLVVADNSSYKIRKIVVQ